MSAMRNQWVEMLRRIAGPVLDALSKEELRKRMPVEAKIDRSGCTHLEAFGRLLCGMAPYLESAGGSEAELARLCIDHATRPGSADYLWSPPGTAPEHQMLVDAAFFAHALARAPHELAAKLDARVKNQVIDLLRGSRVITPGANNWLLFSAMVERALLLLTGECDLMRIDYALRQHEQWYKGDGAYGDGEFFHWDFYNSFVIQPMLLDVFDAVSGRFGDGPRRLETALLRMRRYTEIQERLIAPDGSFPAIGRSIAYRCGAFQALAQLALRRELPETLRPAAVREALNAVIFRTLSAPGTFDDDGYLRIGLAGHQPGLGENYISTGSLYLASTAFLPLGLDPGDEFWSAPPEPWSAVRIWSGEDFPADHAVSDREIR